MSTQYEAEQLMKARQEIDRLKSELAQAKADSKELTNLVDLCDKHLGIRAEEPARLRLVPCFSGLLQAYIRSREREARLTGEVVHWKSLANYFRNTGNSEALRDLLAPTIELFESMQDSGCSRRVHEELSRLRSLLTSNAKSDTNTP